MTEDIATHVTMSHSCYDQMYVTSYPEGQELSMPEYSITDLIEKTIDWHYERNLIDGSTDKDQVLKLFEELAELSNSVCKKKSIKDDIGDMLVVMINICERNGLTISDCLYEAYNEIKDRKGKMVDGIFVKEYDLQKT